MLTNKRLKDFVIRATDGELGSVVELYFDDETWAIRYLVVDTGGWLERPASADFAVLHNPDGLGCHAIGCGVDEEAG